MQNESSKIKLVARVIRAEIKKWDYDQHRLVDQNANPRAMTDPQQAASEVVEVRAVGEWGEQHFPVSLFITVYPGCGAIPVTGDHIAITVEQAQYPLTGGASLEIAIPKQMPDLY
jgi:hypothetical protein